MLVYDASKKDFLEAVLSGTIADEIQNAFQSKLGRKTGQNEYRSWQNSMTFMNMVISDNNIPDDVKIAIEFMIPSTSKRIDFIISGLDDEKRESVIVIELKQWEKADKVEGKEDIVKTYIGKGIREVAHPSYQAWSYVSLLRDFNETVQKEMISLYPCAFLHNYDITDDDPICDEMYKEIIDHAPLYGKKDINKLRNFISKYIKYGDNKKILYKINNGKLAPSKRLQDVLSEMLLNNEHFVMIDEQKVAYELAVDMSRNSYIDDKKRVLIVEGGPGTGKSVIAINLLVNLIKDDMVAMYVTKNSAPREVYFSKLKGSFKQKEIKNLFKNSGSFISSDESEIDVLIVDEAHRLNEKSGLYKNKGENQIKEIINAAKTSIFFIDDNQKVTISDIGSVDKIKEFVLDANLKPEYIKLESQFRCNGSDGYLMWLDDVLQIKTTANFDGFDYNFDFRVIDNPEKLKELIFKRNYDNNRSRLLAGYCWNWDKDNRENSNFHDIQIDDFSMSWNLGNTSTWAIDNESICEIGCIHTSQGLEFDYVGVILGEDIKYENGKIITDFNERASTDRSLHGIKKMFKEDPDKALKLSDEVIKNTYRTLMTRGMKGCYIYCVDKKLQEYFKKRIKQIIR